MTLQELVEAVIKLGIEEEHLDLLVHDRKASEASAINNAGMHEQLLYLEDQLGQDLLICILKRLMEKD